MILNNAKGSNTLVWNGAAVTGSHPTLIAAPLPIRRVSFTKEAKLVHKLFMREAICVHGDDILTTPFEKPSHRDHFQVVEKIPFTTGPHIWKTTLAVGNRMMHV